MLFRSVSQSRYKLERNNFPPIIFEANNDAWFEPEKKDLFDHLKSLNYQIAEIRPFDNMYVAINNPNQ